MTIAATPLHRFDPRRASIRFAMSGTVFFVVALLMHRATLAERFVGAWDAGSFFLLTLAWMLIWRADNEETECRAAASDPGRTVVWVLVLGASLFSLFAATAALRAARQSGSGHLMMSLCLIAVATAWSLTHTSFTLRYAHLYYRDDAEGVGGVQFPGDRPPAYLDFAYLAFTVGMCFQVSDVTISSPTIRKTVLVHAMLSFLYNTAIIALALSVVTGFLS